VTDKRGTAVTAPYSPDCPKCGAKMHWVAICWPDKGDRVDVFYRCFRCGATATITRTTHPKKPSTPQEQTP